MSANGSPRNWHASRLKKVTGKRMSLPDALRHRDVLLLAMAYFAGTCGTYGLTLWMPKIIQRLGHLSVVKSSLLSAIPALVDHPWDAG